MGGLSIFTFTASMPGAAQAPEAAHMPGAVHMPEAARNFRIALALAASVPENHPLSQRDFAGSAFALLPLRGGRSSDDAAKSMRMTLAR